MPAVIGREITGFISGEPLEINRSVVGVPDGYVIDYATLRVLTSSSSEIEDAIIYNRITTDLTSLGQVVDDGDDDGEGNLRFLIAGSKNTATLQVDPSGVSNNLYYEAVEAGQDGNNITITYLNAGASQALAVSVDGSNITVTLETDGASTVLSTADDVKAAIEASTEASALVTVTNVGLGTGVVAAFDTTNLSGGNGGTEDLTAGTTYYYIIKIVISNGTTYTVESGSITPLDPTNSTSTQAATTTARAATSNSPRTNLIVNEYLDVILSDFRQLKVWDEHARRSAHDQSLFVLTYKNLNEIIPEVYDAQNNRVNSNDVVVDYSQGTLRIDGDTGHNDYFVTYTFDMFPPEVLEILVRLKLQELNVLGAADGGYLTTYTTVDEAPGYWDGPLTMGAAAEAYKRLQMDSGLWKNYLIWQNGAEGQRLAGEAADWYYNLYLEMSKGLKRQHLIAAPTDAYSVFRSVGFGFYASSNKFREVRINKLTTY